MVVPFSATDELGVLGYIANNKESKPSHEVISYNLE
jgi:hypothetical protein